MHISVILANGASASAISGLVSRLSKSTTERIVVVSDGETPTLADQRVCYVNSINKVCCEPEDVVLVTDLSQTPDDLCKIEYSSDEKPVFCMSGIRISGDGEKINRNMLSIEKISNTGEYVENDVSSSSPVDAFTSFPVVMPGSCFRKAVEKKPDEWTPISLSETLSKCGFKIMCVGTKNDEGMQSTVFEHAFIKTSSKYLSGIAETNEKKYLERKMMEKLEKERSRRAYTGERSLREIDISVDNTEFEKQTDNETVEREEETHAVAKEYDKTRSDSLVVMMTTHNRTATACTCLLSLLKNIVYDDVRWIISDDRSEPGHVERILSFMEENGFDMNKVTVRGTNEFKYGLGAAINNGLDEAFKISDIVLRTEDDWYLEKKLDVAKYARILEDCDVCGIRMAAWGGSVKKSRWDGMLVAYNVWEGSKELVFNNQVMMIHRRSSKVVGRYPENTGGAIAEETISDRYNRKTGGGNEPPFVLIDEATKPFKLNNGPFFTHIGVESTELHNYKTAPKSLLEKVERTRISLSSEFNRPVVRMCYIGDDRYMDKIATSVKSLSETPKRVSYDVHVLTVGSISNKSLGLFDKLPENIRIDIRNVPKEVIEDCISVDPSLKTRKRNGFVNRFINGRYGMATQSSRWHLHRIFDFKKILYVDGDIIFRRSPIELFFTDVSDVAASGVQDAWNVFRDDRRESSYINSGVILFNLEKCRSEKFHEKCNKKAMRKKYLFPYDQDVINEALGDDRVLLPVKFNFPADFIIGCCERNKKFLDDLNSLYKTDYKSLHEMLSSCVCMHFCDRKPWLGDCHMSTVWNYYADMVKR